MVPPVIHGYRVRSVLLQTLGQGAVDECLVLWVELAHVAQQSTTLSPQYPARRASRSLFARRVA
jgi:hypothetical protein